MKKFFSFAALLAAMSLLASCACQSGNDSPELRDAVEHVNEMLAQ